MTPRQALAEILADYRFNVRNGMTREQSMEILRVMIVDLIEYEKDKAFKMGERSGHIAAQHDELISKLKERT